MTRLFFAFGLALAVGCSSATNDPATSEPAAVGTPPMTPAVHACPTAGASRCEGVRVQTCLAHGDATAWSTSAECPGDQTCRDDACQDPTARQVAQAKQIGTLADSLFENSAWHEPVDVKAVKLRESKALLKGDGTDLTFVGAAWRTMNAFPQGHQSLYAASPGICGKIVPLQQSSRFGVCDGPRARGSP
jgi:hypothetical protein